MRVVFMGTPALAADVMEGLAGRHDVVLAVTRPDAVSGRGSAKRPTPVKQRALDLGIPVLEAERLDDQAQDALRSYAPDAICVAAYGCLLPVSVLELPQYGCLNAHLSLLPRWRGAAPLERALLMGDSNTGVSVMKMEAGLDTGPYCMQLSVKTDGRYLEDLESELARAGAQALADTLDALTDEGVTWQEQDEAAVTYAEKIGKDELALDPAVGIAQNDARVRASSDAHPARCVIADRTVTVEHVHPVRSSEVPEVLAEAKAGFAYYATKRLYLACADGLLEIEQLKPSGKNSMEGKAFAAGIQNFKKEPKPWKIVR